MARHGARPYEAVGSELRTRQQLHGLASVLQLPAGLGARRGSLLAAARHCRQAVGPGCRPGMRGGGPDFARWGRHACSRPQAAGARAGCTQPHADTSRGWRRAAWRTRSRRARGLYGRTSACGAPPGAPGLPVCPPHVSLRVLPPHNGRVCAPILTLSCQPTRALSTVTVEAARALPTWPTGA